MGATVAEPPRRRPEPLGPPSPPSPAARRPRSSLPEPPAFRASVPGSPTVCASCSGAIPAKSSPALCWGCGRPLCTDCYWRHGLTPAAHRCTRCLTRSSEGSVAISGGRSSSPIGFSGRT
jgi:hypothetical protein